ncbi:PREDICTED: uncharacterized protein LOC107163162 [Diuraphis noxia]|uniref:uncharacterized protein LOC107163162 n=1 Tax=Diuraphis noxia TaxID=143948 RepID=UPI0007636278|nr:PREDICTED: uncharacterized protein LOC107163162 [Diuraphis noxia]
MFLSYTVVPVFVFTILLNFNYVYSDEDIIFNSCKECLESECHTTNHGPCIKQAHSSNFRCVTCTKNEDGHGLFYTYNLCEKGCHGISEICTCSAYCYLCATQEDVANLKISTCTIPKKMLDDSCRLVDYEIPEE